MCIFPHMKQMHETKKTETDYIKAVRQAPLDARALNDYGAFLLAQNRLNEAKDFLKRALAAKADDADILHNIGLLHYKNGNLRDAEIFFLQAIKRNPTWSDAYGNLGNVLRKTGRLALAETAYRRALKCNPSNAAAWADLGQNCFALHKEDEAADCLKKSVSLNLFDEITWISLLNLQEKMSRLDEAFATLESAKKHIAPSAGMALVEAKLLRRRGRADEAIALMEGFSKDVKKNVPRSHPFFYEFFFELGQLYDRADKTDKAFDCFVLANDAQASGDEAKAFDKAQLSREITRIKAEFKPQDFSSVPLQAGLPSPVFLIGFPRSGTTLLDQILSSHPDIQVAEEKPAVDKMAAYLLKARAVSKEDSVYTACLLNADDGDIAEMRRIFFAEHSAHGEFGKKPVFVDKLPLNILQVGLIKRVFPDAKFILALRHPCDSVLSCFMQQFKLNAAMVRYLDIKDAARFYDEVFGLLEHFQKTLSLDMHTIHYEDVVSDFQATIESVLGFLGVGWNDAVLEYDRTSHGRGRIYTPSYHQVTEKIYTRASGRWLRYKKHMRPVLDILAPYAEKHGYEKAELEAEG